jgi:hypothetical protein
MNGTNVVAETLRVREMSGGKNPFPGYGVALGSSIVRNGPMPWRVVIVPLRAGGTSVPTGTLAQAAAVAPVWQYTAGLT